MPRTLAYLVGGLLLLAAWAARGDGPPAPNRPAGVRATVRTDAGATVAGTVTAPPAFRIDADYGTIDLRPDAVKGIDFADGPDGTLAVAETVGGHLVRGRPRFDAVALAADDGTARSFTVAELREVSVERPKDLSLVGIVLGLVTLSVMEVVLGIDNVIFLAIVAGRLPKERQPSARRIGLAAALGTRLLLLFSLSWLLGLTRPVFTLPIAWLGPDAAGVSWRDLILLAGGLFLIGKSVMEMHHKMEEARGRHRPPAAPGATPRPGRTPPAFAKVIVQIAIIDIVFSLDSVITAVGMVDVVWVMVAAMVVAMGVMLALAGPIAEFVDRHPTVKVLALAFLILIGALLVAEGLGQHIDKGYVYFAMGFAVVIEFVNMKLRPRGVAGMIVGEDAAAAPAGNPPPADSAQPAPPG
jgi:predicted tellurium resistance membrane protein TerC